MVGLGLPRPRPFSQGGGPRAQSPAEPGDGGHGAVGPGATPSAVAAVAAASVSTAARARRSTFCMAVSGSASPPAGPRAACGVTGARRRSGAELVERRRAVGSARDHHGHADLAHDGVGSRHDRHLGHVRVRRQHRLDLERVDVVAAPDEHLLGPAGQAQAPGVVDAPQVAGVQPAVAEGRGGGFGVAPVAAQLRRATAGRSRRPRPTPAPGRRRRGSRSRRPARGRPDREQGLVVVGVEGGGGADAARLGGRVADGVGRADAAGGPPARGGGREGAAHHDGLHRREAPRRSCGSASSRAICGATPPTKKRLCWKKAARPRRWPPASSRSSIPIRWNTR